MRQSRAFPTLLIAGVVVLSGCVGSKLSSLDGVRPNEAIVIARFRILYNGQDVTSGTNVVFNLGTVSVLPRYQYILEDDGLYFATLPTGQNTLDLVTGTFIGHRFSGDQLSFDLPESGRVYFLGDITMDWHGRGRGSATALAIAAGPILSALFADGEIEVAVGSDSSAIEAAFRTDFPAAPPAIPALLRANPGP